MAIVGSSFGGVGAAVMLRQAGYQNVTVFERGERVGGVWHHNTYPGAACDVPSHLYEFSFAPNPRWSRRYAPQPEIQAYLEDVARDFGVLDRIRTGTEAISVHWQEARDTWLIKTSAGDHEADVLIAGSGQLSVPKLAMIKGLETFEGPAFHTAEWRARRGALRKACRRRWNRLQRNPGRAGDSADRRSIERLPALPGVDDSTA